MKVVILAGGYGTRLGNLTNEIPKPMIKIGNQPIIWHIMNIYSSQGFNEFIIALGYKGEIIKKYFLDFFYNNSDFTIDLYNGITNIHNSNSCNWKVTLVDTGINAMTGGRIIKLKDYLSSTFMLTYGDGVANIDLNKLLSLHNKKNKILTISTVHPTSKYGKVELSNDQLITNFTEKPEINDSLINAGFMVAEPKLLNYITSDNQMLEREPFSLLAFDREMVGYKHNGFWHCMDTPKDYLDLNKLWNEGNPPWKIW